MKRTLFESLPLSHAEASKSLMNMYVVNSSLLEIKKSIVNFQGFFLVGKKSRGRAASNALLARVMTDILEADVKGNTGNADESNQHP